ncbi:MAG: RecB family exonuclease [Actinomycetota bacterium]
MEIRLSYTAASTYERCPLAYRYQYIDGLEVPPSPYLSFGRSLHAALEWFYGRDVPEPPTLEELLAQLERCWDSEGYTGPEEEEGFLAHAREVLESFYHRNRDVFRLPVALEQRFEIPMDGYLLTGVIDRVDRHPDGAYEVIDYKTNRRLPELRRLREDLQLPIYQMACRELWGITPAKLSFYYLLLNQKFTTSPRDEKGLAEVRERLGRVARGIRNGDFSPSPNPLCPWCPFLDVCPTRMRSGDLREELASRRRALLLRRRNLDQMIEELESQLRELDPDFLLPEDGED